VALVVDQLRALLGAYGYNLYDRKNRARADDLLVREKAAEALAEAATALRSLRTAYHRRFVPPPSRESPSPPPEHLAALQEMARLQERLADLETRVRGMPVPTQDQIWERFRREGTLLNQLLLADYSLIAPSQELRQTIQSLTPPEWLPAAEAIEGRIDQIEKATRDRAALLRLPGA
jgi:hypothetical protein